MNKRILLLLSIIFLSPSLAFAIDWFEVGAAGGAVATTGGVIYLRHDHNNDKNIIEAQVKLLTEACMFTVSYIVTVASLYWIFNKRPFTKITLRQSLLAANILRITLNIHLALAYKTCLPMTKFFKKIL
jgi:hypothetical protein